MSMTVTKDATGNFIFTESIAQTDIKGNPVQNKMSWSMSAEQAQKHIESFAGKLSEADIALIGGG